MVSRQMALPQRTIRLFALLAPVFCSSSQSDGGAGGAGIQLHHTEANQRLPTPTNKLYLRGNDMNVLKNMEAIFLTTLALIGATSYASAAIPAHLHHGARVSVEQTTVDGQQMAVVKVTAKRLSAAEKARI
jgi:hypothetical protein